MTVFVFVKLQGCDELKIRKSPMHPLCSLIIPMRSSKRRVVEYDSPAKWVMTEANCTSSGSLPSDRARVSSLHSCQRRVDDKKRAASLSLRTLAASHNDHCKRVLPMGNASPGVFANGYSQQQFVKNSNDYIAINGPATEWRIHPKSILTSSPVTGCCGRGQNCRSHPPANCRVLILCIFPEEKQRRIQTAEKLCLKSQLPHTDPDWNQGQIQWF